jgi:hypothetical protein
MKRYGRRKRQEMDSPFDPMQEAYEGSITPAEPTAKTPRIPRVQPIKKAPRAGKGGARYTRKRVSPDYTQGVQKVVSYRGIVREFKVQGKGDRPAPAHKILNIYISGAKGERRYKEPPEGYLDVHKEPIRKGVEHSWKGLTAWYPVEVEAGTKYHKVRIGHKRHKKGR